MNKVAVLALSGITLVIVISSFAYLSDAPLQLASDGQVKRMSVPENMPGDSAKQQVPAELRLLADSTIAKPDDASVIKIQSHSEEALKESVEDKQAFLDASLLELLAHFEEHFNLDTPQKVALEIFISRLPTQLSDAELLQLIETLQVNEETVLPHFLNQTIERLYTLKQAEDAYLQSAKPPANSTEMQALQADLRALRERILGASLYNAFFPEAPEDNSLDTNNQTSAVEVTHSEQADSHANLGEWIDNLENSGLSQAEINQKISEKYGLDTVENLKKLQAVETEWLMRYLRYIEDKRYIMQAGLTDEDKEIQIRELIKQHYAEAEYEAARAFDKMMSQSDTSSN